MSDNNQNKPGQLQINVRPDVAQGVYSNLALINHSSNEFVIDFASLMPGIPKAEVVSRVILAPEHAKRLLAALQDNIDKYEREFGRIDFKTPQGPRTISPFGKGKGEA